MTRIQAHPERPPADAKGAAAKAGRRRAAFFTLGVALDAGFRLRAPGQGTAQ
jgi:hypothetical protein